MRDRDSGKGVKRKRLARDRKKRRKERERGVPWGGGLKGREVEDEFGRRRICLFVCLFGFLTSSSTTRLYRGRTPRQSV